MRVTSVITHLIQAAQSVRSPDQIRRARRQGCAPGRHLPGPQLQSPWPPLRLPSKCRPWSLCHGGQSYPFPAWR